MAGEDQERLEDYLALERYIEALQAGRVAHIPAEVTPDLARIYCMALSLHATSSGAAAPRPEFLAELQAKLTQTEGVSLHLGRRTPHLPRYATSRPCRAWKRLSTTATIRSSSCTEKGAM